MRTKKSQQISHSVHYSFDFILKCQILCHWKQTFPQWCLYAADATDTPFARHSLQNAIEMRKKFTFFFFFLWKLQQNLIQEAFNEAAP